MRRYIPNIFTIAPSNIYDIRAGIVVFFVALPLCLGVAFASNVPIIAGIISGIIGGILVGFISGSHTSVSGPAAGLTAVIASQIAILGSFETFLAALIIAGLLQIAMGLLRIGSIAAFFPSSVIKGLLAAIGIILVLKQLPHLIGFDEKDNGEMLFTQPEHQNTFSEILNAITNLHFGAFLIGFLSLGILILWDKIPFLRKSFVPSSFVVIFLGLFFTIFLNHILGIESTHRVQVPVATNFTDFLLFFTSPDYLAFFSLPVYKAGLTLALVASLETLLNLEAVDKIDPLQRISPKNRELIAQGFGNFLLGIIGGMPITSVVVRGSVNINAGGKTKKATIIHGICLFISILIIPSWINYIPLSALAAILILTGFKLASPKLIKQMYQEGPVQFLPFIFTIFAIVFTDLLIGVVIGLIISIIFILHSNIKHPLDIIEEKLPNGAIFRVKLANQVSFLNKAALSNALEKIPEGTQVVFDGSQTHHIDMDIVDLIQDFKEKAAPVRGHTISLLGFKSNYQLENVIKYVDHTTVELQKSLQPNQILQILKEGNKRILNGQRIHRDINRQISATSKGQFPMAVVVSCIDSRTPVELIFDLGIGDIFSIRMAGNIISEKVLGNLEFACLVGGAKLIVVMGHTRCGAIGKAIDLLYNDSTNQKDIGSHYFKSVIADIQKVISKSQMNSILGDSSKHREEFEDKIALENILHNINNIHYQNNVLKNLINLGQIQIVGCIYDVRTGCVNFIS